MNLYQKSLSTLIQMASIPGFKEHAWQRAKELSSDKTGLWAGIEMHLKREMLKRKAK